MDGTRYGNPYLWQMCLGNERIKPGRKNEIMTLTNIKTT
jgi:hypothetical protein